VPLALVISIITAAVFVGAVAWALLWLSLRLASLLRFKGAFPEGVQNAAGGIARRELRRLERELAVLMAGASAALSAAVLLVLYGNTRLTGVWRWREARFAARAQAAFAASLARLNLQGLRVFHDVALGDLTLDHVVLGLRGLFAIRVVTRRPARGAETVVRINGRSIEFQDGFALLDTLSLTERASRALADMQVKGLSHRPHVLPVVAVPGWEIAPAQGAAGEIFLANEKTAMLLTLTAKPADSLMDADVALLQEHLTKLSMDTLL
jgi:hypothetical protein